MSFNAFIAEEQLFWWSLGSPPIYTSGLVLPRERYGFPGLAICPMKQFGLNQLVEICRKRNFPVMMSYQNIEKETWDKYPRPRENYIFRYRFSKAPDAGYLGKSQEQGMDNDTHFMTLTEYLIVQLHMAVHDAYNVFDQDTATLTSSVDSDGLAVAAFWDPVHNTVRVTRRDPEMSPEDCGKREIIL